MAVQAEIFARYAVRLPVCRLPPHEIFIGRRSIHDAFPGREVSLACPPRILALLRNHRPKARP